MPFVWIVLPVTAALDFVVAPAALSNCRNPPVRSTGKFRVDADFRLDGFSVTSRESHIAGPALVDMFGDRVRAVCEERRICQRCGPFGGRPSATHRSPTRRTIAIPAGKISPASVPGGSSGRCQPPPGPRPRESQDRWTHAGGPPQEPPQEQALERKTRRRSKTGRPTRAKARR